MTRSEIESVPFTSEGVQGWRLREPRLENWPVVYVIEGDSGQQPNSRRVDAQRDVYVGETLNAVVRMRQHLTTEAKQHLTSLRVIVDDTFNKSVCLDLESFLIRMLAGDGKYSVLNRNDGITDAQYFDRQKYQPSFDEIFEELKLGGVFSRTIREIENSDLFKLSPFKSLQPDQAIAVEDILDGLFEDIEERAGSTIVIQGEPGTGKTVIAIFLTKLLVDIAAGSNVDDLDSDSLFSDYFTEGHADLLRGARFGLVVPQQSLRKSIKNVFKKTPGLLPEMVLSPFEVGSSESCFDLLFVDEAHRLNQRANQPSAAQNTKFREITKALFGADDESKTQLDWIKAKSKHQVFLLDAAQSVRPSDLPEHLLTELISQAEGSGRRYPLVSQMRVKAGSDYVGYVRKVLAGTLAASQRQSFEGYDLRIFDSVTEMHDEIKRKDAEHGLARLVAGYAWPWKTKTDKSAFDIEIGSSRLRWNNTQTDWIASAGSLEEVGSIHTVQGYDLNYAGVIIGNDLRYDVRAARVVVDKDSYFDKKGKETVSRLGDSYTSDNLWRFVQNVYAVLLTRGIRGTYVYVCDPALRAYLRTMIEPQS